MLDTCPPDASFVFQEMSWLDVRMLRLRLLGSPWWEEAANTQPGEISLICEGVEELNLSLRAGTLCSGLHLSTDDPLLWEYGPFSTIFGTAPLPDPQRFFYEFYELVSHRLKVRRDPARYLNWESSLKEWEQYVYSRAYRLLSAPAPIAEATIELLEVQAAEFTVLPDAEGNAPGEGERQEVPASALQVLSVGSCWIVAKGISVEV